MAVDFFEKEVRKVRQRFNETFGRQTVCNLDARYSAILSICRLGILTRKISSAKNKENVRDSTSEFIRIRDVLNNFFNLMEKQMKGRRGYTDRRKVSNNLGHGRQRRSLPELR